MASLHFRRYTALMFKKSLDELKEYYKETLTYFHPDNSKQENGVYRMSLNVFKYVAQQKFSVNIENC